MENKEIDLLDIFKCVWNQKKKIIKWGIIGVLIGIVVAFSIPKQYTTVVKIAPEGTSKVPSMGSMGGLAAIAGIDMGVTNSDGISAKIYPEIIHSTPFLLEFVNIQVEHNGQKMLFYDYIAKEQRVPWWSYIISLPMKLVGGAMSLFSEQTQGNDEQIDLFRPSSKQSKYVNSLKQLISVSEDKKSGVLTISNTMQDPLISAVIADSLLSRLQRYMTEYRTTKTRADLSQNTKMFAEAQSKYYRADSIYATEVDQNRNLISQSAKVKLERLANEKVLTFSIYQQLATQVELSKVKLQEDTPIATVIEPASVAIRASSPEKLKILIAFFFLGGVAAVCVVTVRQLFKKQYEG